MKKSPLLFWLLLPLFYVPPVPAAEPLTQEPLTQERIGSLEELCAFARENSLDYRKALLDAAVARNDVDGILELEESSFNFDTSLKEGDETPSASAGVVLPLLDQLSLNGSVDSSEKRSLGLTLSPLAHSDDRSQQSLERQRTEAYAEQTGISAENVAIEALLDWLAVDRTLAIQEERTQVMETIYRDEKIRYEAGESTLDDVRTALMDWTDAGKSLSSLQNELSAAELSLITALNADPADLILPELSLEDMEGALADLKQRIRAEEIDAAGGYDVLASRLELRSLEEELKDTWLFDPDLSFTGTVSSGGSGSAGSTDSSGSTSTAAGWSATLSLSFSLQDWQREEREELEQELTLSRLESALSETENRLALEQDRISLDNAAQSSALARLELEEAEELYDEAEFLYGQGEYSQSERDEAFLDLRSAEISLFTALAGEYGAWRSLLLYEL